MRAIVMTKHGSPDGLQLQDVEKPTPGDNEDFYEITAGVNYYFMKHNAKVTVDVGYLPEGSPVGITGAGIFASDDNDQFYVRGQFQLLL